MNPLQVLSDTTTKRQILEWNPETGCNQTVMSYAPHKLDSPQHIRQAGLAMMFESRRTPIGNFETLSVQLGTMVTRHYDDLHNVGLFFTAWSAVSLIPVVRGFLELTTDRRKEPRYTIVRANSHNSELSEIHKCRPRGEANEISRLSEFVTVHGLANGYVVEQCISTGITATYASKLLLASGLQQPSIRVIGGRFYDDAGTYGDGRQHINLSCPAFLSEALGSMEAYSHPALTQLRKIGHMLALQYHEASARYQNQT